ncbi:MULTISPECIES: hypothetical protein [Streptococcus]|uniref:Uncharacterized protein n=1 Tax=Streptococcus caledonicus TaxID=2614158 RepID=A0ABW0UEW4_9STRE|nr:hypothetical protein [Streptococcus sp. S784/96/1]
MKNVLKSDNWITFFFLVLYGGGVVVNVKSSNLLMASLWAVLFLINLGMLLYRIYGKKDKNNDR